MLFGTATVIAWIFIVIGCINDNFNLGLLMISGGLFIICFIGSHRWLTKREENIQTVSEALLFALGLCTASGISGPEDSATMGGMIAQSIVACMLLVTASYRSVWDTWLRNE